jgi:ubiquinone/menaquinone biosynthesis C-methylase UbiE
MKFRSTDAATIVTLNDMPAYEIFGKFYDAVMGDRSRPAEHLEKLIRASNPNARNLLELGCGTGSMLKHMQHNYEVSGLDTSSRMLHEEDIVEVSFPPRKIVTALHTHFEKVRVIDPDGNRPIAKSERLFFIATAG